MKILEIYKNEIYLIEMLGELMKLTLKFITYIYPTIL